MPPVQPSPSHGRLQETLLQFDCSHAEQTPPQHIRSKGKLNTSIKLPGVNRIGSLGLLHGRSPISRRWRATEWRPVAEYFRKLDECLEVEISQFEVWRLDEADRRRFEFFIEHHDPRRLREAIRESVEDAQAAWEVFDEPELSATTGETLATLAGESRTT